LKIVPRLIRVAALAMSVVTAPVSAFAQAKAQTAPATLSVFLDCGRCDEEYMHTEITYVNWVRDPAFADVHVLVTNESTGSGGTQFTPASATRCGTTKMRARPRTRRGRV
jgi:hypothetical protein